MRKVLISLVSEQTIPNVLFIRELSGVDRYIFISSPDMEQKLENRTDRIIAAAQIPKNKTQRFIVDANDYYAIMDKMQQFDFDKNIRYIINITGGTKMMAIACLNFFRNFKSVELYYVPIGEKEYHKLYPIEEKKKIPFKEHLTLFSYLTAYGLSISSRERLLKHPDETQLLFDEFIRQSGDIERLPGILNAQKHKSKDDKKYYSGGWFEEFVYFSIKQHFDLSKKEIGIGVKLENTRTENEYDVVFIKNNTVYIVECKAFFRGKDIKQKIESALYKLSALDDDFGINSRSVFITTYNIRQNNPKEYISLKNRAKDLGVLLLEYTDLANGTFLKKLE